MDHQEVLDFAWGIIRERRRLQEFEGKNFLQFANDVVDIVKYDWGSAKRNKTPGLQAFLEGLKALSDDFEAIVAADPMMLYSPANRASLAFHSSDAYVRYFRAGNRTSKTQSGYAEHYLIATDQHRWRDFPTPPAQTFIVGMNFSKYGPSVFERKFITGEDGNPLSPMFPKGGKWFYHYDERKKIITIACPACANAGKSASCPHPKSTITLFSDVEGWEVLQGGQYRLGHFDEHINEEFFNESIQRTQTVRGGCLIVTGTPLHGEEAWEQRRLTSIYEKGGPENRVNPEDKRSPLFVELFEIDQFEAGLVPHDRIKMSMKAMDEFEIESRVYGKPAPLAKNPVFDRRKLAAMRETCTDPWRGHLHTAENLEEVTDLSEFTLEEQETGPLRVWEEPDIHSFYIVGVDTAKGLYAGDTRKSGDYSAACVLKVIKKGNGIALELVAQYHGHINPFDYAAEVFKLCVWYNSALAVIELTGGYGEAVMLRMREEFHYWNFYKDRSMAHSSATYNPGHRLGVDTNKRTKPYMVAALQQFVADDAIKIACKSTIQEMVAYEQERTDSGLSVRYRGVGGTHDDRVMALVIAASVAVDASVASTMVEAQKAVYLAKEPTSIEWREIYKDINETDRGLDPFEHVE